MAFPPSTIKTTLWAESHSRQRWGHELYAKIVLQKKQMLIFLSFCSFWLSDELLMMVAMVSPLGSSFNSPH